jgi:hypothetical protein
MATTLPALTEEQRNELTDSRSPFTAEDRVTIAMAWTLAGGHTEKAAAKATRILGREVLASTIRQWRTRSWWLQAEEIGKSWLQKDLEHKYTRLLHETEKEILDRVKTGDTKVVNGELVRVPVSLRDLVGAHAVVSDKRSMIRGEPTSRKEDSGIALAAKLFELLQRQGEKSIEQMPSAIDGEWTEVASPATDSDEVPETPVGPSAQIEED